jgi:hypothetical protein
VLRIYSPNGSNTFHSSYPAGGMQGGSAIILAANAAAGGPAGPVLQGIIHDIVAWDSTA